MTQQLIRGVVHDAQGNPLAAVSVFYSAAPGPTPDVALLTDPHGGFVLAAPVAGDYELTFTKDGYKTRIARANVATSSVTLQITLDR
jgi:hypothetical protein